MKKKISSLQKKYDDLVEAQGDESEEAKSLKQTLSQLNTEYIATEKAQNKSKKASQDLEVKILNQKASVGKLEKELGDAETALNDLASENGTSETAFDSLTKEIDSQEKELKKLKKQYANVVLEQGETSTEAQQLATKITELNGDLKKNKSSLKSAESAVDKLGDSFEDAGSEAETAGDGFTIMKGTIADLMSSAIQGLISGIGDLATEFLGLSEATKEYRSMQAKLEGSAETFGYSVDYATGKYKEFYKYLGDDQASTNAITNLMGLQTSQESLSKLTEGAIGVWSAYGDSIPIESLTESINETAQVGKVTGVMADALNWAGESEDKFNEKLKKCNTTQERADLIADMLNKTYGESKKKYDENTGSIQDLASAEVELKDTQAEIADTVDPLNTALTELKNDALEKLQPVIQAVVDGFMAMKKWAEENPVVIEVLKGVVIGLATAFTGLAIALGIQALINGVQKAMALLNTTLLANPITWVIAGITALVVAFLYLWNNVDGFRKFFENAWKKIKEVVKSVWESYLKPTIQAIGDLLVKVWKNYLSPTIESLKKAFETAFSMIKKYWDETLQPTFKALGDFFKKVWDDFVKPTIETMKVVFDTVFKSIKGIWNEVLKPVFKALGTVLKSTWDNVLKPTLNTLKNLFTTVFKAVKTVWDNVLKPVIKAIGTVLYNVWKTQLKVVLTLIKTTFKTVFGAVKTVWNKVLKPVFKAIGSAFKTMWDNVLKPTIDAISGAFDTMGSTIKGIWNGIWSAIKGVINSILGGVESMANGVVGGINKVIDVLNNLSFTIPKWVPKYGGKKFGFDLNHLNEISIPRLAEGGLARKNDPFLAVVGDNKKQDEIISPVDTMRKIIADELRELKDALVFGGVGGSITNASNSKVTNNTFNQYITSPQPLSRLDIYRQTRNLQKLYSK